MTLLELRKRYKLTLRDMSARCDVSMPVYKMMEQGRLTIDERMRENVRKAFKVELSEQEERGERV